ncbi:MAG: hypothetical protein OEV28_14160, partial [Nitrospirota bacterium]|nr:hypothetical protein [Nitrospirota bacterium]
KERADQYINHFMDCYICSKNDCSKKPAMESDEKSFNDYIEASEIFDKIHRHGDLIYSLIALGNAYKEAALPDMSEDKQNAYFKKAEEAYQQCIDVCLQNMSLHSQDYYFVMLEQMNLMARKRSIKNNGKKPKRVNIYHSLKSPESHHILHGLYYFAIKNNFEIWEYRFGKVMRFDEESKFIGDRLGEACALIILASEGYDVSRDVIEKELDYAKVRLVKSDPLVVFGINLGNRKPIDEIFGEQKKNLKWPHEDKIDDIFKDSDIKDIYECREIRMDKDCLDNTAPKN